MLLSASFISCENIISDDIQPVTETPQNPQSPSQTPVSNKGCVQIKINPEQLAPSGNSRTVLPVISYDTITRVVLSGSHEGSSITVGEWSSYYQVSSVMLELGYWDLSLTVVNNGKTFTSESESVYVESGQTKDVSFTLTSSSTEGGLSLQVYFTGDAVAAKYRLLSFPSDTEVQTGDLAVATSPYKSVTYSRDAASNPLSNGHYRVVIEFYADTDKTILLNTYSEIVRVRGGFTSTATRTIDLNNLYHITYEADGGTILSGSYGEYYSLHSDPIALPILRRTGYVFDGWFKDDTFTDGPHTEFDVSADGTIGEKYYYAKWSRVCAITYYIAAEGFTTDSECIELTEDQCDDYGLPQSHTQGTATLLPLSPVVNENSIEINTSGYTLASISGTALTSNGSNFTIPASVSTDTSIYVHIKSHIAYIDPIHGDNSYLAFNPSTPAQTISGAKKWIYNADSDLSPVLYVKSSLTNDLTTLIPLIFSSTLSFNSSYFLNTLLNIPIVDIIIIPNNKANETKTTTNIQASFGAIVNDIINENIIISGERIAPLII